MIDRKQEARTPRAERGELRDSIDQIARRLDELLRDMADVAAPIEGSSNLQAVALDPARRIWRARRERDRIFGSTLAADPGWDILLDLFIAMGEGRDVTVSSASAATGMPEPVVLRCIAHLVEAKLVARQLRPADRDIMLLTLTERAAAMMAEYLDRASIELGVAAA